MASLRSLAVAMAFPLAIATGSAAIMGLSSLASLGLLLCSSCIAIAMGHFPRLAGLQYTVWIVTAVLAGLCFPSVCLGGGWVDLRHPWLILIIVQGVMFGMGTQMRLSDFSGILRNPRGVLVGLLCQFSIMPIVGYCLAKSLAFEPEIAAGIILVGSCSSGLASNVMSYLAKANLALSVTVTACATLLAPLVTPLLMTTLAGTMVEIDFWAMMAQIFKIVLVPIGAALLHDFLRQAKPPTTRRFWMAGALCLTWLVGLPLGGWSLITRNLSPVSVQWLVVLNFSAAAIVAGLLYHASVSRFRQLNALMPYLSMLGIVYFTTVTTAAGRDSLLAVGFILFGVAIVHNTAGYGLGYFFSRVLGLDKQSARAMALEVGLQNGGMASGIAGSLGMLATLGLPAAVFSPWMNISGSLLANYWKNHPPHSPQSHTANEPVPNYDPHRTESFLKEPILKKPVPIFLHASPPIRAKPSAFRKGL